MRMSIKTSLAVLCLLATSGCGDELIDRPGDVEEDEWDVEGPQDAVEVAAARAPAALVSGCTATASLAGHPIWLHFTRPTAPCLPDASGTPGVDTHILAELVRLIDSVPAGQRIDANMFNITVQSVGAALLRAQERGVRVAFSTDKRVGQSTSRVKTDFLDRITHRRYCGSSSTGSCIGSAANAIAHTKLFAFSRATAPDGRVHSNVSWFGSANQTSASGMELFNNTVTVYGDATLYTGFRTYLDHMFRQVRTSDYYTPSTGRGHVLAAAADAYMSPESTTDLVVNRLDDVTPNADCRVRVMHASIRDSRMAVVNRLIAMKRGGCKVWVVAHTVEPRALAALRGAGISVREHLIHDKAILVRGNFGGADRFRVYTGSHNLSISANRSYDELFVKLAAETSSSHPVYDAFFTHFNDAYNDGRPL
jgi:hypothetical protein